MTYLPLATSAVRVAQGPQYIQPRSRQRVALVELA